MTQERKDPTARAEEIMRAAIKLALTTGVEKLTRRAVAKEVGVTDGLVSRYLGNCDAMRGRVLQQCAAQGRKTVVRNAVKAGAHMSLTPRERKVLEAV